MDRQKNRTETRCVRIGISACLLGRPVRYDGIDQRNPFVAGVLSRYCEAIPICPETECGLGVPRDAMRLVGSAASPRLVVPRTGVDLTARMQLWCQERIAAMAEDAIDGFVLKSRSPSCGLSGQVKVFPNLTGSEAERIGTGLFARAVADHFPLLPVIDEGTLEDIRQRENFIERVFFIRRWREAKRESMTVRGLIDFHSDNKLQVLAHSEPHYRALGRIAALAGDDAMGERLAEYEATLAEALNILPTPAKHQNVLQHMAGYFKKILPPADKRELSAAIDTYRQGLIPLLAPITLLNHYTDKYGEPYLARQHYLRPDPAELMLRYHA